MQTLTFVYYRLNLDHLAATNSPDNTSKTRCRHPRMRGGETTQHETLVLLASEIRSRHPDCTYVSIPQWLRKLLLIDGAAA